jgi:hypothetical protein
VYLERGALHAPNHQPTNGLKYRTIHNIEIQQSRRQRDIQCEPGGVIHDYVSFYFGPRSPMLYLLHINRVEGYLDGQAPIIYLVSTAQAVQESGAQFVFSDGHGIASFTRWFNDLGDLNRLDWDTIYAQYWESDVDDMDRKRRKQSEFLVHRRCDWSIISEIGVINNTMKEKVEVIMKGYKKELQRLVNLREEWYY